MVEGGGDHDLEAGGDLPDDLRKYLVDQHVGDDEVDPQHDGHIEHSHEVSGSEQPEDPYFGVQRELGSPQEVPEHHQVDSHAEVVDEQDRETRAFGHFVLALQEEQNQAADNRAQIAKESLPPESGEVVDVGDLPDGQTHGVPEHHQHPDGHQQQPTDLSVVALVFPEYLVDGHEEEVHPEEAEAVGTGGQSYGQHPEGHPDAVVEGVDIDLADAAVPDQLPEGLLPTSGSLLLVHDEGDEEDGQDEGPPGRFGDALALDIDRHPARHDRVAERTSDQQQPTLELVELNRFQKLAAVLDQGKPSTT